MANLSTGLTWDQARTIWAGILNPIVTSPFQPSLLTGVVVKGGTNVINHKLGRTMQGWFITDINNAATIYRSAPLNDLTLTLTSNMGAVINLAVF